MNRKSRPMMPERLRLLCDSNPMCYGSSTAMLSILDHLEAECTALVRDVTREVLTTDDVIQHVIPVNNKSPEAVREQLDTNAFDAVLAVSNQSNIELYKELGLPVFFVDVLYWFGPRKDQPVWQVADQTFVQTFPGVTRRLQTTGHEKPPTELGPLIRPHRRRDGPRRGTLAQIGGARSRFIRPGINSSFPRMVVDWLKGVADSLPHPITLAGGRDAIAVAREHTDVPWLRPVSLPNEAFLEELCRAECYLTTPGQGAVFEGLSAGVDVLFLPPQNATQVAQLRIYEQEGLVAPGLNLPDLDPDFDTSVLERGETELTPEVLRSLRRIDHPGYVSRIVAHLREQRASLDRRERARDAFMASLGAPGGPTVAQAISRWWNDEADPITPGAPQRTSEDRWER